MTGMTSSKPNPNAMARPLGPGVSFKGLEGFLPIKERRQADFIKIQEILSKFMVDVGHYPVSTPAHDASAAQGAAV